MSLADRNNLIRQIYLFIFKYKGDFNTIIERAIIESYGINFSSYRPFLFDSYLSSPVSRDINDERLKLFAFRYYNGEIKGLTETFKK